MIRRYTVADLLTVAGMMLLVGIVSGQKSDAVGIAFEPPSVRDIFAGFAYSRGVAIDKCYETADNLIRYREKRK